MELKKKDGLGKKILMLLGICFILLVLLMGGFVAYVAISNPKAIQGDPQAVLQSLGVKKEDIPTTVTPAQEACAVQKLGQKRVNEIKAGSAITTSDVIKAKSCF